MGGSPTRVWAIARVGSGNARVADTYSEVAMTEENASGWSEVELSARAQLARLGLKVADEADGVRVAGDGWSLAARTLRAICCRANGDEQRVHPCARGDASRGCAVARLTPRPHRTAFGRFSRSGWCSATCSGRSASVGGSSASNHCLR